MKRLIAVALVFLAAAAEAGLAQAPVKLLFWTHEDKKRESLEGQYMKDFMAANPNVTIERVLHHAVTIQDATFAAFAANQGPDIFNF